jgi:GTP-binding protein
MHALSQAQFLRAVGQAGELPAPDLPEIAFAGRSNVGKSSAINALLGRRNLARTSKTPGRTQTINFYQLGEAARLVDLPGYGFARVAKTLRAQWGELVGGYLRGRSSLRGVVVVMDARHPMTPLDRQLLQWLEGYAILALLSKADKLNRTEQARVLARARADLGAEHPGQVLLFSSTTRLGVEALRDLLEGWIGDAVRAGRGNKKPPVKGM